MNYFKHAVLALGLVLATGCASLPSRDPIQDQSKAEQIVSDSIPFVRTAAAVASKLAIQYGEQDAVKREDIKDRINSIATNLDGLLIAGNFDPNAVTQELKIKEDYVDSILETVALLYRVNYDKLKSYKQTELAIEILRALIEGVREGTQ